MRAPFQNRNFRLLCLAEAVSYIGDQVSLIAFPWLALQMTGSPAIMGLVLACHGLPRALLMLFGGAVVDRTSPRAVMMASQADRFSPTMSSRPSPRPVFWNLTIPSARVSSGMMKGMRIWWSSRPISSCPWSVLAV